MSYIWELNIADMDGSDFYFPIESERNMFEETVKNLISVGKPVNNKWTVPIILKKEEKYAYDFFHIRDWNMIFNISEDNNNEDEYIPEDAVCISQRVYDELYSHLKDEVEFLPMLSDDGTYYVMNVTNYVDCLNKNASDCLFAPNGLIIEFENLIFDMNKVKGHHIFRIPQHPHTIYLVQELKEIIEGYEEVSFSQDELVFDEVSYYIDSKQ